MTNFATSSTVVASGSDGYVDPSESSTGAVELHTLIGDRATTVYFEADSDGDGTYELSVAIDSFGDAFFSQQNKVELHAASNHRLRFHNDSGSNANYAVTGVEI